jgi:hypothetical protein
MQPLDEVKAYVQQHQGKAQIIRVADVFIVGPLMIYGGRHLKRKTRLPGITLEIFGWLTIFYNGLNYLKLRKYQ